MGISACPDCTTINNHRRTICRTCGAQLKPYATPPAVPQGRITFDVERAVDLEGACSIPVLFNGHTSGINVILAVSPLVYPLPQPPVESKVTAAFRDARAAVIGALSSRRRAKL